MYSLAVSEAIGENERERLILEHLPQVRLIARRIQERLPENVSLDDLVSTGVIGLISAIDNFDPSQNVKLQDLRRVQDSRRDSRQPSRARLGATAKAPQVQTNRKGHLCGRTAAQARAGRR